MTEQTATSHFLPYHSEAEILQLISAFESCSLPREEWTHQAHLTVGYWYLSRLPREEATALIRESIQKYNHACGVVTTKEGGYHETITLFYVWVINKHLTDEGVTQTSVESVNRLLEQYGERSKPLEYYSRERLMSWQARQRWVEPDLKPLD